MNTQYNVVMDGYTCTGNSAPIRQLGTYSASSPKAACRKALKENGFNMKYWNSSKCTWWGCEVYANEILNNKE